MASIPDDESTTTVPDETPEESVVVPPEQEGEEEKEQQRQQEIPQPAKEESSLLSSPIPSIVVESKSHESNKENRSSKSRPLITRDVISSSSSRHSRRPVDFIDTLVQSYKTETGISSPVSSSYAETEKKYVPKTQRTRLNPNWREHRTRRLMNKLEELSLWDREEELKASQAEWLRAQKWEQIQDRQRNHDLCLNLMRARHESEMESAVTLDRGLSNEETGSTIAATMKLSSPANILAYDIAQPPATLRRRVRQQEQEERELGEPKTPIGRYRQFESSMTNKLDKINDKIRPDREIMRAYSPHLTHLPATVMPLFSETYASLLAAPDPSPRHYYTGSGGSGAASYLHYQPQHASSPDFEARLRSYANRDVRVPLKEQANEYSYTNERDEEDNDYTRGYYTRSHYSPPRRTTSMASPTASSLYDYSTVANTPREYPLLTSRAVPPSSSSSSIQNRSLTDDLNTIARFSLETSKKILQNLSSDRTNGTSAKPRTNPASSTPSKRVTFMDSVDDEDLDYRSHHQNDKTNTSTSSRLRMPELLSLSSLR